jgi:pyruvate dehydrogenase E1 component alpha subunit
MNMAALWKLPVLFIVENNGYAMGTSVKRSAMGEFWKRGEAFNIPGKAVDGMDVLAVREAAGDAAAYIREGRGPYLLEMRTYRYKGHSMSDPAKYRSKEEVERFKEGRDPIETLRARIIKEGLAREDDFKPVEVEVKQIVKEAEDFSLTSPQPNPNELWTDILLEEGRA